ncbi:MAG: radical SAM protein [Coriobacteriaceae bacterium]
MLDALRTASAQKNTHRERGPGRRGLGTNQGNAPEPDVRLGYFILSENCNLACKYCFVGSDACGSGNSYTKNMTKGVAEKAIDVFARQLELSSTNYEEEQSDIIFFGGEPLLQFDVLVHVVERVRELVRKRPILAHTQFAVITNGTLLDERRILKLHDLGVAVSIIDGFTEANEMRVDKAGRPAYARVIEVLEMYAKLMFLRLRFGYAF